MGMVESNSCFINVLCYADRNGTLELSRKGGKVERKLAEHTFAKDVPVAITLDKLKASTEYSYKISFNDGTPAERTFVTQRRVGQKFTFTIQADSHLDGGSAAYVYLRSLESILATPSKPKSTGIIMTRSSSTSRRDITSMQPKSRSG